MSGDEQSRPDVHRDKEANERRPLPRAEAERRPRHAPDTGDALSGRGRGGRGSDRRGSECRETWRPPACVLIHLAWRTVSADSAGLWTVWVGRSCFPYSAALLRGAAEDRALLERSLFVSADSAADRLWAVDLSLRSPAVGVVIGDGSGFDLAATRRVQLAGRTHGTLVMTVRPPWEQGEWSAAQTRWMVRRESVSDDCVTESAKPSWSIELLRSKGVRLGQASEMWRLEWDRAACTLHLSAALADSAGDATAAAGSGRLETARRYA